MSDLDELYDYGDVRSLSEATMFVASVSKPTLVLGSAQPHSIVNSSAMGAVSLRRRRGGGGVVLLEPGDLWVDWWIPRDDERWDPDVHVSSIRAGSWWSQALSPFTVAPISVHRGVLDGDVAFRVVCFAGRGPGEVFLGDRKVVGVTQWRVREGVFLSSVLHLGATDTVLGYLSSVPAGLAAALESDASTEQFDRQETLSRLVAASGPVVERHVVFGS